MRLTLPLTAAVLAVAALAPAAAQAVDYPPPTKPVAQPKPKGPFKTLTVCAKKKKGCQFTKIQKAVDKAKPGWTIKVADGTYREGVIINKPSQRYIKLVGNPKNPKKVRLIGTGLKNLPAQNGVAINAVAGVTVDGFYAYDFAGNGFFVTNITTGGYVFNHLFAEKVGTYGIYAFNSIGGTMMNSTGTRNNDAGFYIGQTPVQAKPVRTIVKNVTAYENVLGWSGTNMKYVTITKSKFFNNGTGIVPNNEDTEKFTPNEQNVISDNDIFLNNFNYYKGASFPIKGTSAGGIAYPVGVGLLLFGGHNDQVLNNRVYGNYGVGIGAIQGLIVKDLDAQTLKGNIVKGNVLGNGGKNRNGRDFFYDGNGVGNCWTDNVGVQTTLPATMSTFTNGCAGPDVPNGFDAATQATGIGWVASEDKEVGWIKYPQDPVPGVTPLEHYTGR